MVGQTEGEGVQLLRERLLGGDGMVLVFNVYLGYKDHNVIYLA